eukprot:364473-Chlamydomonas_euryale.AAC.5
MGRRLDRCVPGTHAVVVQIRMLDRVWTVWTVWTHRSELDATSSALQLPRPATIHTIHTCLASERRHCTCQPLWLATGSLELINTKAGAGNARQYKADAGNARQYKATQS